MAKKKTNNKKEAFSAFKVSDGRAKKAKKNKSNINFKKFNMKTKDTIEKLDSDLGGLAKDVRTKRVNEKRSITPTVKEANQSVVNIDETVEKMSNL